MEVEDAAGSEGSFLGLDVERDGLALSAEAEGVESIGIVSPEQRLEGDGVEPPCLGVQMGQDARGLAAQEPWPPSSA